MSRFKYAAYGPTWQFHKVVTDSRPLGERTFREAIGRKRWEELKGVFQKVTLDVSSYTFLKGRYRGAPAVIALWELTTPKRPRGKRMSTVWIFTKT
jgi:hypothetical protein